MPIVASSARLDHARLIYCSGQVIATIGYGPALDVFAQESAGGLDAVLVELACRLEEQAAVDMDGGPSDPETWGDWTDEHTYEPDDDGAESELEPAGHDAIDEAWWADTVRKAAEGIAPMPVSGGSPDAD